MAITLTIAQVSGVIAALVFVVQFLLPNAFIVLLVGFLKNEHTVVTWSAVQRQLLTSLWPTVLQTDSSASRGVDGTIRFLAWLRPISLGLVTIAAVVTPLGLYQDDIPERHTRYLPMEYIADPSPMGYGTPPRSHIGFSRQCGAFDYMQCPGTNTTINYAAVNETEFGTDLINGTLVGLYDMQIPEVLLDLYQSGLKDQQPSVSSFFDIETRQYIYLETNTTTPHLGDSFRFLTTVVLNDAIEPFEGVIVDTKNGGIGFRNHTIPVFEGSTAEWHEDILWIEPETVCVNHNLSLEHRVPFDGYDDMVNITLIDEGGFSEIPHVYPHCDLTNTQENPELRCRAYKAAWMTNVWTMFGLNITRPAPNAFGYLKSHVGSRFPLIEDMTTGASSFGIVTSSMFDSLAGRLVGMNYSLYSDDGFSYPNPFNLTSSNFSDISLICEGAGGMDEANLTNILTSCGMVFGAPMRADGNTTLIFEPGTVYRQKIYTCASTNKASIKSVKFKYNTTDTNGFKALTVMEVAPKLYDSPESMPLWGVETPDFLLNSIQQLWGLISNENQHAVNLSTVRQGHLYLPGYQIISHLSNGLTDSEYIPAATSPLTIIKTVYNTINSPFDYTGNVNFAMYLRWRDMSQNLESMAKVLNLIWADLAANYMIGTRNLNTDGSGNLMPVTVYRRAIRYHWYYGIPAMLSLVLVGSILGASFMMFLLQRGTPGRIRYYLYHLSSGRLLGLIQYPGESDKMAPTKEWIGRVGRQPSNLSTHPYAIRQEYPYNEGKGYMRVNVEDEASEGLK